MVATEEVTEVGGAGAGMVLVEVVTAGVAGVVAGRAEVTMART